ncbi:MAG: hypothetical protein FWE22_06155 [Firmicutes bacterium]|nr:hypothetical protein [Bacillota bacterium]
MFCSKCGHDFSKGDVKFCLKCGVSESGFEPKSLPPANHQVMQKTNPTAMILGIIATIFLFFSIVFCWIPFYGIVLSLIGLFFASFARTIGAKGLRKNVRLSKVGAVLGTVSIIVGIIFLLISGFLTALILALLA